MKQKILFMLILLCITQGLFLNSAVGEIDKPLLKINYTSHGPFIIDGDTQLNQTVQNEGWSGSGTDNDPYIIDDLFISTTILVDSSYYASITIKNIHQHLIVKNNQLRSSTKYNGFGIYLLGCSNITILDNNIEFYSIATNIINSDDIIIRGNTIFDNVAGTYAQASGTLLYENNAFLNSSQYSFYIRQTDKVVFQSNNIMFSATDMFSPGINNLEDLTSLVLFNNTFADITNYGVVLNTISDAQIISNSFVRCEYWDMSVYYLTSSNITRNQFIKTDATTFYGNLNFVTSNTNIISENNFYAVSPNVGHITTDTTGNLFYNNGRGNYYSKYSGVDDNGDGIGDTPYTIVTDVSDLYPLMKPVDLVKPVLTSHDSELIYEKDEDVVISWIATDDNPADYKVYEDNSLVKSDIWVNGSNEVDLGNLSIGTHAFSIKLLDIDKNFVSFNVTVVVQDTTDNSSLSNGTDPLGDIGALITDNIIPIAAVSGVGIVSILTIRRIFGGKKKPRTRKPKKKKK